MGWISAAFLVLATLAGLRYLGHFSRRAMELAIAACLIAMAGYAWQGSPDMPESRATGTVAATGSDRVAR